MKVLQHLFCIIILLTPSCFIYSQDNSLYFNRLGIEDGLSHSNVFCAMQDKEGFIWFGTDDGLNRYNGYEFNVFRHTYRDSSSISNGVINCIFEDSRESIWVGTQGGGLNLFSKDNLTFKHLWINEIGVERIIFSITEGSNGNIYIITDAGFWEYSLETKKFEQLLKNPATKMRFTCFLNDDNDIYLGTNNKTIVKFNVITSRASTITYYTEIDTMSSINTLTKDSGGNIWIGTNNGIYINKNNSDSILAVKKLNLSLNNLNSNDITSIVEDNSRYIWIGTKRKGIIVYDPKNGRFSHHINDENYENSLSDNDVRCLLKDNNNTIWIGTYDGGVNFYNKSKNKFSQFKHIKNNENSIKPYPVNSFSEDSEDNIWIGLWEGGFDILNKKTGVFNHSSPNPKINEILQNSNIRAIVKDHSNNLWFGTTNNGLIKFNIDQNNFVSYNLGYSVYTLYVDINNDVWIGTMGNGIYYYDKNKDNFLNYQYKNNSSKFIRTIVEDHDNNLWLGTHGGGLLKFNKLDEKFTNYVNDVENINSISHNVIFSLLVDHENRLWIGTDGAGLNLFNRQSENFIAYTEKEGLSSDKVYGILEDLYGNYWISTNNGISKLSCQFFENDPQKIKKVSFKNYDISDGLRNEFKPASCYYSKNGIMYFGGVDGFNYFNPNEVIENDFVPQVVITDFKISNLPVCIGCNESPLKKHISRTNNIELSYYQDVITFQFTALNFINPHKNQYAFKLQGFEDEWNYVGNQRTATYTNLRTGNYVFHVKACNNDGVWNSVSTQLPIRVNPPYWKTKIAYMAYIGLALFLLFVFQKYSLIAASEKNRLKMERFKREKTEELNQVKLRFFTNVSHEFKTPLTLILGTIEEFIDKHGNDQFISRGFETIQKNAFRLLKLVNQLLDFRKSELKQMELKAEKIDIVKFLQETTDFFVDYGQKKGINIIFRSELNNYEIWCDIDKLEKITHNLISNAFKFTLSGGNIEIKLSLVEGNIVETENLNQFIAIEINDNGIGIDPKNIDKIFDRFFHFSGGEKSVNNNLNTSSGIGLSLVKNFTELHKGKVTVKSMPNEGSTFTVYLPVGNKHLTPEQIKLTQTKSSPFEISKISLEHDEILQSTDETVDSENNNDISKIELPLILIVEDNTEVRNYLKKILRSEYRLIEASNGKDGVEKAKGFLPDLVISDVMMPEKDGLELCEQLKTDVLTSHIPIVLLTARSTLEQHVEGLETGADSYISKPFSIKYLKTTVSNLILVRKKLIEKYKNNIFVDPKEISSNTTDNKFIQKILDVIEEKMSNPDFNVETLSHEIFMSRSSLHLKLKSLTGQSTSEFINKIRLKKAAELLIENELNSAEISYEVGFNSTSYFNRSFKKQFNMTPMEYRSKMLKK